MNIGLRKLSLFLFVILLISNLTLSVSQGKDEPLYLQQNLSELEDKNGEIVEQKQIKVASKFKDKIDCYKIKYLSDGLEVVGFIFKPKNQNSKLPVLIFNRGGNKEYGKLSGKLLGYLSLLSSNNYVVLASQYRGNDGGQGREQFGGSDINDVLDLIPLAKSLQFTDPDNIFMLGFSRGGMMTYLAIKYGAQINAAAVVGGISDLWRWYGERSGVRIILGQLVGLDEKEYHKRSAVHWPEKINVPVLILHGARDVRVSVNQAKELSKKLDELDKEHELFVFPTGNHSIGNYKSQRNAKIFEWFDKYKKQPATEEERQDSQVKIEIKLKEVSEPVVKGSPKKERANLNVLKTQKPEEKSRNGRFIAYKDGTVVDTETNLMWWSKCIEVSDIHNAQYNSKIFRWGGYSDWRLPAIDELKTIYDESNKHQYKTINLIFLATPYLISKDIDDNVSLEDGTYFKYIDFKNGRVSSVNMIGFHFAPKMALLPVRNVYFK